jgi:hypothetical protein
MIPNTERNNPMPDRDELEAVRQDAARRQVEEIDEIVKEQWALLEQYLKEETHG